MNTPDSSPLILPASPGDLDSIYRIARLSFPVPWSRDSFRQELKRRWVALRVLRPKAGENVCGFSHFWLSGEEIQLQHLAVAPEMRRSGYGRALLSDLIRLAKGNGAGQLWLEVRASNQAAIALYLGAGFIKTGIRSRYYSNNDEDAILMNLEL